MKIQKKNLFLEGGRSGQGGGWVGGCQGGWERRITAFVKIQKKKIVLDPGGREGRRVGGQGWM